MPESGKSTETTVMGSAHFPSVPHRRASLCYIGVNVLRSAPCCVMKAIRVDFAKRSVVLMTVPCYLRACTSAVVEGTTLQAGKSWVPYSMSSMDFSINLIVLAVLWPTA
jgi:hypothetical protein